MSPSPHRHMESDFKQDFLYTSIPAFYSKCQSQCHFLPLIINSKVQRSYPIISLTNTGFYLGEKKPSRHSPVKTALFCILIQQGKDFLHASVAWLKKCICKLETSGNKKFRNLSLQSLLLLNFICVYTRYSYMETQI